MNHPKQLINFTSMNFSDLDKKILAQNNLSQETIKQQYSLLKKERCFPILNRPATIGDGINIFSEESKKEWIALFQNENAIYNWCRFIPASGAASRMFAHLVGFLKDKEFNTIIDEFKDGLESFAFYNKIENPSQFSFEEIIRYILFENGLNYSFLPKALIYFHSKEGNLFRAFESQLLESEKYSRLKTGEISTHFTISFEHKTLFEKAYLEFTGKSQEDHLVSFSFQASNTNTIALDDNDEILHDADGNLVLRPGGHGALLQNLQELNEDFIFIRNIDNVLSPVNQNEYVEIHQMMGGYMIEISKIIFDLQKRIDKGENLNDSEREWIKNTFHLSELKDLKNILFRPIRIAGMVKNTGEPGGGPFFIKDNNGLSLQIIEKAQVNISDKTQLELFNKGTHFNPVDLCVCIKNYKDEKYSLQDFTNEDFSFISSKNFEGRNITILEHPGLWNGSMHYWLTVFIEIPISIFNPVKTVNDLLRPAHLK